MVKTEIAFYIKRAKIELQYLERKLNLLDNMVEDDILEDCADAALDLIISIQGDHNKAYDLANNAWLKLHNAKAGNEVEADG